MLQQARHKPDDITAWHSTTGMRFNKWHDIPMCEINYYGKRWAMPSYSKMLQNKQETVEKSQDEKHVKHILHKGHTGRAIITIKRYEENNSSGFGIHFSLLRIFCAVFTYTSEHLCLLFDKLSWCIIFSYVLIGP